MANDTLWIWHSALDLLAHWTTSTFGTDLQYTKWCSTVLTTTMAFFLRLMAKALINCIIWLMISIPHYHNFFQQFMIWLLLLIVFAQSRVGKNPSKEHLGYWKRSFSE
jgi:hypothetical protein